MKNVVCVSLLFIICVSAVSAGGRTQSKVPAGRIEVTYIGWGNEVEQETVQKTLDAFNSSQSRIWATYIPTPEDYMTKLNTMASSNSLPDAGMLGEDQVLRWAANDMLLDISNMFKAGEDQPLGTSTFLYQGKPVAYSLANETMLLYFNKDIFDKAGIPYPPQRAENAWTWNQFVDAAKKLTKDANGRSPGDNGFNPENIVTYGAAFNYGAGFWPIFGKSNGGGWISDDGKQLLINSPETIEAAQAVADLYLKHHCVPNPTTGLGDGAIAMLSGQVAMAVDGQWAIGLNYANAMKEGLNYSVAVLPKFKVPVTCNTGGPAVVFKSSKHPAEAMEMVKQFYDPVKNKLFVQSGIWMPVLKSWYENEEHIRFWADHPDRPPLEEYRHAVINYTKNNLVQTPYFYLSTWSEFNDLLTPAMDPVWAGSKTAKEALNEVYPKLKEVFDRRK
ncbi:MAG: sugar ABC transporter substrate-binding protein [Treponema sp.]|jgi:multiple sugar transport system substrate-binding protein|nr:sugar ABC transporter substrate-binding protein [Treponema sp.]